MSRKIMSLFIAFIMFAVPFCSVSAAPVFKDVTDFHASKAEFDYLVENGILTADPTVDFGVREEITRIQAVELLASALKLDMENRPDPGFVDVLPGDEKYPFVAAIVDEKIMSGYGNGYFLPDDKLNRGQMAVILANAFKLSGTSEFSFKDVPDSYWAFEAIHVLIANKITNGYLDYTYRPFSFISKKEFVVFLARILNPAFRVDIKPESEACEKPSKTKTYKVDVQVTTLWNQPGKNRVVDRPSLSNPVDIPKWTKSMSVSQKWWLVGRTDTQAMYGDEVTVLNKSGNWVRIAVKEQYVPYQKEGYPGWVTKQQVVETSTDYSECSIAIVTAAIAPLYNPVDRKKFMDISYSTILPVLKEEGEWLHVHTPGDGVKLLKKKDAKTFDNYESVPYPAQKDIVNEAKRFLDLPYLWAGTSALGYDCSGIIYSVYKNHGILIPRDSFYQATKGTPVAKKNLQPGDLVFFANNGGKGKVYHVGLYIGSGKMLHAPNASSKVKIESMNAGAYKRNYSGARRYLSKR